MTVWDDDHPQNDARVEDTTPGQLYVGEKGNGETKIEVHLNGDPMGSRFVWAVDGTSVLAPSRGNFAGANPVVTLKPVGDNRDFNVTAGWDRDADGLLDAGEVMRTVNVTVVRVDKLTVTDQADGFAVSNPAATEMWLLQDASGNARIKLSADAVPVTAAAREHVLWDVLGGTSTEPTPNNFSVADPVITLTPGTGQRNYDVKIGFDDNQDKSLQAGEIDRMITVHVLKLDWEITSINSDGSNVTDLMELDPVKYKSPSWGGGRTI